MIYARLRPILRTKQVNEMRVERQTTYSMEVWMVMSWDALKATDHAREAGAIRGFTPWELDRNEGAVPEPMINRSLVTIRLLMREPYCGITANIWWRPRDILESVKVITRYEFCWYILGLPARQGTIQLFALCVCPGPSSVLVLMMSTFGARDMRESQVRFSERDNNRNWVSY